MRTYEQVLHVVSAETMDRISALYPVSYDFSNPGTSLQKHYFGRAMDSVYHIAWFSNQGPVGDGRQPEIVADR